MIFDIPSVSQDLKDIGVRRRNAGGCSRGGIIIVYRLPFRLTDNLAKYFLGLGQPANTFATGPVFKIEKQNYNITGIKRLKEIRFTIKKQAGVEKLLIFEDLLKTYVKEYV